MDLGRRSADRRPEAVGVRAHPVARGRASRRRTRPSWRPAPGPDDPTAVGATLKIVNPTSGESASVDLPSSSWSASSSEVQYKFKNPAAPSGPSAVRVALLRNGSIKVRAESTLISLNETSQGSLGVVLSVGSTRYCALFGGQVTRDMAGRFDARKAPAPTSCPGGAATATPGTSVDVYLDSNVDGETIAFHRARADRVLCWRGLPVDSRSARLRRQPGERGEPTRRRRRGHHGSPARRGLRRHLDRRARPR
jgi:hypothetical protein